MWLVSLFFLKEIYIYIYIYIYSEKEREREREREGERERERNGNKSNPMKIWNMKKLSEDVFIYI